MENDLHPAHTVHVINSAVLKLGKLTQATTVFRGISFRTLPRQMKKKDPESLTRGGIEYGFCSCSTEEEQAITYANTTVSYTHLTLPTKA